MNTRRDIHHEGHEEHEGNTKAQRQDRSAICSANKPAHLPARHSGSSPRNTKRRIAHVQPDGDADQHGVTMNDYPDP
jgi:hypothetical protein